MAPRHALAPVALALAASLLLGACSDDSADQTGAPAAGASAAGGSTAVAVAKDPAHWTMPTDPYSEATISDLEAQARDTLRKPCMVKAGYTDFEIRTDASAPLPPTLAADGVTQVFNESVASRYGYRMAPNPRDLLADKVEAAGGSLWDNQPQEFWDALNTCDAEADKQLGSSSQEDQDAEGGATSALSSQLNQLAVDLRGPALTKTASTWRDCMAPLGIVDLPSQPWTPGSPPPQSLATQWSWQTTGQPSAEELTIAAKDAACRRSSGWQDALYEAEWNARQDFVTKHQAELTTLRQSIDSRRAQYQAVIAKGH